MHVFTILLLKLHVIHAHLGLENVDLFLKIPHGKNFFKET
jgi:hypothetical protein